MFDIHSEEQIKMAVSRIDDSTDETTKLVKHKAVELWQLLEELRVAKNQNAGQIPISKRPTIGGLSPDLSKKRAKNSDLKMLALDSINNKKAQNKNIRSEADNEIRRLKLSAFYVATYEDLGFKTLNEKDIFDVHLSEYLNDTILHLNDISEYLVHLDHSPNHILKSSCIKMSYMVIKRIDVWIIVLYKLHPFIITFYRQSVFDKVHTIQLIMTLIDKEDNELWYTQQDKSTIQQLISNIVLNKDEEGEKVDRTYDLLWLLEETLILKPDIFIAQ